MKIKKSLKPPPIRSHIHQPTSVPPPLSSASPNLFGIQTRMDNSSILATSTTKQACSHRKQTKHCIRTSRYANQKLQLNQRSGFCCLLGVRIGVILLVILYMFLCLRSKFYLTSLLKVLPRATKYEKSAVGLGSDLSLFSESNVCNWQLVLGGFYFS